MDSLAFTVETIDQGDLREFSANAQKLAPKISSLRPGQLRWRRNNADNRHRFAGKLPNGLGFVAMVSYDPDDLTSTYLQGSKLLTQLNSSAAAMQVLKDANTKRERSLARKKSMTKGKRKNERLSKADGRS